MDGDRHHHPRPRSDAATPIRPTRFGTLYRLPDRRLPNQHAGSPQILERGDKRKYHDFSNWAVTRLGLRPTKDVGDGGLDGVGHVTLWNPQQMKETNARILAEVKTGKPTLTQVRAFCHVMDQHNAEVGIFITIEPVSARMQQEAQNMGSFEHNQKPYPRLQFWRIDDAYFENPDIINTLVRLPDAWRIRPTQKSERHFDNRQMQLLRD